MNKKLETLINKYEKVEFTLNDITSLTKTLKRAFESSHENFEDCFYLENIIKIIYQKLGIMENKLDSFYGKFCDYVSKDI